MNKRMVLRIITFLFTLGTFSPSLLAATATQKAKTGPITYQEIGDAFISSFGIVDVQKPIENNQTSDKKKLNLTIPILSQHEKRRLCFEMMARNETIVQGDDLLDNAMRVTLADLDTYFATGKDSSETVMNHINFTDTVFGEAALAYLLAHPVKDISLLQQRQAFIKELVANEELFNELDRVLNRIKKSESGFFSFLKAEDPVNAEFFQKIYWSKLPAWLNKSATAMEASVRLKNFGTFFEAGGGLPLSIGIACLAMAGTNYMERRAIGENVTYSQILKEGWQGAKQLGGAIVASIKTPPADPVRRQQFYLGMGGGAAYLALLLGVQGYQAKVAIGAARELRDGINYLQTRLSDVATIVEASKQLHAIASTNDVMGSGVFSINNLNKLIQGNGSIRSEGFTELVRLLQTNTFKGDASFFSLSGRVLAAYRLMNDEKENFAAAFEAIGEIDACLSMAKLYKKMQNERVSYCFINFVEEEKPYINLVNFWNPFIDPNMVVTNSIELGAGTDASKVILTGSNTGGKSTILKAIMIDLVLLHTFGIAAAKEATVTPFEFIGSYLRVNDDTAQGESKFKAEVLRAKMLCQTMDSLKSHQKGFVVIDELFTGTNSTNASGAASKVALKLAGLENNLYILATHFLALTDLEKDNKGIIKNYKVDIYKDETGNLVRPFKLEVGISTNNVANDILNEEIQDISFGI